MDPDSPLIELVFVVLALSAVPLIVVMRDAGERSANHRADAVDKTPPRYRSV